MRAVLFMFYLLGVVGSVDCRTGLTLGALLPRVELRGDSGGVVTGTPWSTDSLRHPAIVILGTSGELPKMKPLHDSAAAIVRAEARKMFTWYTIIDLTRLHVPWMILDGELRSAAKKNPGTTLIADRTGAVARQWLPGLDKASSRYRLILTGRDGRVVQVITGRRQSHAGCTAIRTAVRTIRGETDP